MEHIHKVKQTVIKTWKIFYEILKDWARYRIFLTPLYKKKNEFYKYNIFIHVCWICIRNLFKDTPKNFTARGGRTLRFSPLFIIWFEFLSRWCCIWDQERHSGHCCYSWYTQTPTTLLLKSKKHQKLCIRNILHFQHFEFSQKQTLSQGFRSKCFIKKVSPGKLSKAVKESRWGMEISQARGDFRQALQISLIQQWALECKSYLKVPSIDVKKPGFCPSILVTWSPIGSLYGSPAVWGLRGYKLVDSSSSLCQLNDSSDPGQSPTDWN